MYLGDASVYHLHGMKLLCYEAFKWNHVTNGFSHFVAYFAGFFNGN